VITNARSNWFSHGTDSQDNFMDLYGTRSRVPEKYSTDLQLCMIFRIDYDNDESSAVTTSITSAATTATTASSVVPVTVMDTSATTTTPVTTTVEINYITSIPN
jgi:endo-alpha-1,4-polygalactosaminidase (GH114 family)